LLFFGEMYEMVLEKVQIVPNSCSKKHAIGAGISPKQILLE